MILAAGKGERMRPLTDQIPKPLLEVKNKPLIQHTIERLKKAGVTDLVINTAYLGKKIEDFLADGSSMGVTIQYSSEGEPLETGGGIAQALPLLMDTNEEPFILINSDVWADIELSHLKNVLSQNKLAHLVLVKNPAHNLKGDFSVEDGLAFALNNESAEKDQKSYTYSGIAVIHPQLFKQYAPAEKKFPLLPLLLKAIEKQQVSAEIHEGIWVDVGTPERLADLNK